MNPCPLCQHVPYEDSEPVSNGYDTFCGNCGTKLWDVATAPSVTLFSREHAAKSRDIWSAIAVLYTRIGSTDPLIAEMYHEACEYAESESERAQDATYDDAKLTALLDRLRGL